LIPTAEPPKVAHVQAALTLLVNIFGDGIVRRLWTGDVDDSLGDVARVLGRVGGGAWDPKRRVDVDVNIQALGRKANDVACRAMDQREYNHAVALLQTAVCLPFEKPEDDILLRYNYACALALSGASDAALRELATAVAHGYRNADHLESDDDLVSLRGREEFKTLVKQCRPTPVSAPTPSPVATTPVVDNNDLLPVPVAVRPSVPVNPNVETLIAIFPGMDAETATEVLAHAGNSVRRAVEMFLGSN